MSRDLVEEVEAMSGSEFWARLNHPSNANLLGSVRDFLCREIPTGVDPCPICGESVACGYDGEGLPLIHALSAEDDGSEDTDHDNEDDYGDDSNG